MLASLSVAVWLKAKPLLWVETTGQTKTGSMNQMDEVTVEQELEVLMNLMEDEEPTYVALHAPNPYQWDTDNVITHREAIEMEITCMKQYPSSPPCKKLKECLTCQGLKGAK